MKTAKVLISGHLVLLDEADVPLLGSHSWNIQKTSRGGLYVRRTCCETGRTIYLHRIIIGAPPRVRVDHANGKSLDCRRVNLRMATSHQNAHNTAARGATSAHKGVHYKSGKWRARIMAYGKRLELGFFDSEVTAAAAYDYAALRLHGSFARLNNAGGATFDPLYLMPKARQVLQQPFLHPTTPALRGRGLG